MDIKVKKLIVRIFDKSLKIGWKMKFMLVLSFIYGFAFTLNNLCIMLFQNEAVSYIKQNINNTVLYFWKENLLFFLSANRTLYILCFVTGLALLYGCYLMWKGFKWGLLFYTLGKFFQISLPIFFLGHRMIAIGNIMIALLFLIFYYVYSFSHQMDKSERKYNSFDSAAQEK
ncbi:MAG: hypothetical protein IJ748_07600 [Bacteroidales bacterium]|nr:hypothetical protein [Bacteroidales bacterium]